MTGAIQITLNYTTDNTITSYQNLVYIRVSNVFFVSGLGLEGLQENLLFYRMQHSIILSHGDFV